MRATAASAHRRFVSDAGKLIESIGSHGLYSTMAHGLRVLAYRAFLRSHDRVLDTLLGADASTAVPVEELDLPDDRRPVAVGYVPTRARLFTMLLRRIETDVSGFTFVDLGSGKGRVLCLAASSAFARVIGVELSRSLHEASLHNIDTFLKSGQARCRDIVALHQDAATFVFPASNLVVYLYNPFTREVLLDVAENLRTVHDSGGNIFVIYLNPLHRTVFDEIGFLAPVGLGLWRRLAHDFLSASDVVIYSNAQRPD